MIESTVVRKVFDNFALYVLEGWDGRDLHGAQEKGRDMLLMGMGILGRCTTKKQPEASPASRVFYRCIEIGVQSCVSAGGCGGSGGSSLRLRRLGLS